MGRPSKVYGFMVRGFGVPLAILSTLYGGRALSANIPVGPTRAVTSLAAGVAIANAGDTVLLDPGTYVDDTATTNVPLTIAGAGPGVILHTTVPIANHKGIIVTNAALTVRNITFDSAAVTVADGNNGAGIRHQAGDLIVDSCNFTNNQDGILVNPIPGATVTITNSNFAGNGAGDGYSHGIYVNEVAQFTVASSSFSGTKVGHDIKSRALATTVSNSVLDDGVTGTTSYAVDLPNGGVGVLDGIVVTQGRNTQNPIMVAYGEEGNLKAANSLNVVNSTFIDQLGTPAVVGVNNSTSIAVTLKNNVFQNVATILRGPGEVQASVSPTNLWAPTIFSSAQTGAQSYFRFYNTGASAGTVTVGLHDIATGNLLAQWVSPSISPGASPQFAVATVEAAANPPFIPPAYYSLTVDSDIDGTFQHVLYRPSQGTLSNLSTCAGGAAAPSLRLANVHSSLLNNGFPSTVVVYNTGAAPVSALLGVYDARNGNRLGGYTTASVAPLGEVMIGATTLEAAIGITPDAGMFHYNIKVENTFTGTLQHLVNNQQAGLTTDMTAVCALTGS